jgi:hypothetical protein
MRIERVVFDTNVLISAVLSPLGPPRRCLAWAFKQGKPVVSAALLAEFDTRLFKPRIARRITSLDVAAVRLPFLAIAALVEPAPLAPTCRDPQDDLVLATAIAGRADTIVTGDEDLLVLDPFEGIRILTLAAFMALVEAS